MSDCIRRGSVFATLLFLVTTTAGISAAQTAVTACGQEVEGDAYLVGDLDCPDGTEAALTMRNGSLDLRGFTIRGGEYGVLCAKGLGTFAPNGEEFRRYLTCGVANGTIADQTLVAIDAGDLTLTDVTIQESGATVFGAYAHKRLRVGNVDVELGPGAIGVSGTGALKMRLEGTGLTITGGRIGISFVKTVRVDGLTVTGYEVDGIYAAKVDVTNGMVSGGERGVAAGKIRLIDSVVTGNSVVGVIGDHVQLEGSTITGNGLDVESNHRPKLENTACGTSNGWGVCSDD